MQAFTTFFLVCVLFYRQAAHSASLPSDVWFVRIVGMWTKFGVGCSHDEAICKA